MNMFFIHISFVFILFIHINFFRHYTIIHSSIFVHLNNTSKESSSRALAINDASEEEFDDDDFDEEDDELSLITRKIRKMWEKKNSSWSNESSNISFHDKEKSLIICYECKKPGHFKSECPDLEKPKDKKKKFFK